MPKKKRASKRVKKKVVRDKMIRKKKIQPGYVPLSGLFMATAIVGFIASLMYVYRLSVTWGFTFMLFFLLMIIASFISMANAPPVSEEAFRKKK